jgi:hypothetical protein
MFVSGKEGEAMLEGHGGNPNIIGGNGRSLSFERNQGYILSKIWSNVIDSSFLPDDEE